MLMLLVTTASAQKTVTTSGEAVIRVSAGLPPKIAKYKAIAAARTNAIEEAFGTQISQVNHTTINNGKNRNNFVSHSSSATRGVWLKDEQEPVVDFQYDSGSDLVTVTASVKGKVREMTHSYTSPELKLMKRDDDPDDDNLEIFREGDKLFLYFNSPVDGYVSAYLVDNNDDVVCMVPYIKSNGEAFEVKKDTDYFFFSKRKSDSEDRSIVDEYELTCDEEMEGNVMYVLFSTKKFSKPRLKGKRHNNELQILSLADFNSWKDALLSKDSEFMEAALVFTIKKRY